MKKLNLQKYDYDETPKPPKTGLKSALKIIFVGFIVMLMGITGLQPDQKDIAFAVVLIICGMGCIAFGIFKILKFLWDNIPE